MTDEFINRTPRRSSFLGGIAIQFLVACTLPLDAQMIDRESDGTVQGLSRESSFGRFGASLSFAGDVNNDGFDDLLIGDTAFTTSPGELGSGGAYLVFGSQTGLSGTPQVSDSNAIIFTLSKDAVNGGGSNVASVGATIAGVGDINNDQIDDFFVGTPGRRVDLDISGGLNNEGEDFPIGSGHIVYGRADGFSGTLDLRTLAKGTGGFEIFGRDLFGRLGRSAAAAGDVNGDGIDDFVVSAPLAGLQTRRESGEVYVIFGNASGYSDSFNLGTLSGTGINVADLDGQNGFIIAGHEDDGLLGASVAGIGDFNGDGFDDLAMTSPLCFRFAPVGSGIRVGAVYIVYGSADGYGGMLDLGSLNGNNGFAIFNHWTEDSEGQIAGLGDFNDDGFDDVALAAKGPSTAHVFFGTRQPLPVNLNSDELGDLAVSIPLNPAKVARAGDLNGDDLTDLLTGSVSTNSRSFNVVYGTQSRSPLLQTFRSNDSSVRSGFALAGGGDFNGDGIPDVFSGGPMPENGASGAVTSVQGTDSITPAYRAWISQFYPGVTDRSIIAPARDANGDGFSNGFSYFIDGDPRRISRMPLEFSEKDGSLEVSYRRRDDAADVISSAVETSADVTFWIPVSNDFFGVKVEEVDDFYGLGVDRVTVSIPPTFFSEVFGTDTSDRIFSRLSLRVP